MSSLMAFLSKCTFLTRDKVVQNIVASPQGDDATHEGVLEIAAPQSDDPATHEGVLEE